MGFERVDAGARDPLASERVEQGDLVDHAAATDIDQHRLAAHFAQFAAPDQRFGTGMSRRRDDHNIGPHQQVLETR